MGWDMYTIWLGPPGSMEPVWPWRESGVPAIRAARSKLSLSRQLLFLQLSYTYLVRFRFYSFFCRLLAECMEVPLEDFKGCGGVGMVNGGWAAGLGKGCVAGLRFHLSVRVHGVINDHHGVEC